MTFNKLFSRISLLALIALVVASCQNAPTEEGITAYGAQLEQTESNDSNLDCDMVTNELGFDLNMNTRNPTPPTFPYAGTLAGYTSLHSVPPFQLGMNCLCRLQKFELEFTDLPNSNLLNLYNDSGDPVPFHGPSYNLSSNTYTVIISADNLNMGLYISYNQTDPSPSLVTAGGLCMVDNVSGPDSVSTYWTRPYERQYTNGEGQTTTEYFVPASTGSVTHRLVK